MFNTAQLLKVFATVIFLDRCKLMMCDSIFNWESIYSGLLTTGWKKKATLLLLNEFLDHVYLHYLLWSYLLISIDKIADAFEHSNSFYPIVISMLMLYWVNMECTQTAYKTQIKNLYVKKKRTNLQILDYKNICVIPSAPSHIYLNTTQTLNKLE